MKKIIIFSLCGIIFACGANADKSNKCPVCATIDHEMIKSPVPWTTHMSYAVIRKNLLYYDEACNEHDDTNYKAYVCNDSEGYVFGKIQIMSSSTYPNIIKDHGKDNLVRCEKGKWQELHHTSNWDNTNSEGCEKQILCDEEIYISDKYWSRTSCPDSSTSVGTPGKGIANNPVTRDKPVRGDNNKTGGNNGWTGCPNGCCDDMHRHANVTNAMDVLNNFAVAADISVWTTADGKFNHARLAVDAASGVVMGTIGGVVSNVIIKNNQVKKGMEGYYCDINSENVAEYGDKFIPNLPK